MTNNIRPDSIKKPALVVSEETVKALSPLEQLAAQILIDTGRWKLIKKEHREGV